uniref:Reduced folate carrier n=1 Tax=Graphocephala atropunctata TaxID=36148 RepID=A0A1B6MFN3_9HEMI
MVQSYQSMGRRRELPYIEIEQTESSTNSGSQKKWVIFTVLIAIYGFAKNISPESPYMAEFFSGPRFNYTKKLVTQEIYPVSVYSSAFQTSIVLFVTDILRYKPVIVIGAFGYCFHKALLVWGRSLFEMQANQFFWGMSKACSLAYKTYIYSKVDKDHFQIVTAIIRIAPKAGTLLSCILSQVALSVFFLKLEHLNNISFAASLMAVVCAILLPSLKHSVYFKSEKLAKFHNDSSEKKSKYGYAARLLWQDFKEAYTNPYIVKWCVWWILASGGFQQVTDYYVQLLWSEISKADQNRYNAGVEAVYTTVSGISCYFIGGLKVNWHSHGELVLAVCTLIKGITLVFNATTGSIIVSYAIHVVFCSLYDTMMVISNSEVAKHLKNESFALIFGTNTFLAHCCQCLLTYVLTSKNTFALTVRKQFIVIGCSFLVLGFGFAIKAILKMCVRSKTEPKINEVTPIVATVTVLTPHGS